MPAWRTPTLSEMATISELTGREGRPKAKAAAMKVLTLDNSLAEAHTTLADSCLYFDWDFVKSDQEFRRAIAANSNYPTAHRWYAEFLYSVGRYDEAIAKPSVLRNSIRSPPSSVRP